MDVAHDAGISYADIRIAEQHALEPGAQQTWLSSQLTYGIRALASGAWGFAYGRGVDPDAVARCAREAVRSAKTAARLSGGGDDPERAWTPPPVATGEWRIPVEIDPFTVPLQQQAELNEGVNSLLLNRIPDVRMPGGLSMRWTRETRIFASTAGSQLTQHLMRGKIDGGFNVQYGQYGVAITLPDLGWTSRGYEACLIPNLIERFDTAIDEAVWLAHLPYGTLDVGRYPLVVDGHAMGAVLTGVLGPALELDRVLGDEVDASGGSRFTLDLLGTSVASPLLTLTGHRNVPEIQAVQWDDDGAVPQPHTVIENGVLTDYHTSGSTVSALADWYRQQNRPLQSNGCASVTDPQMAVMVQSPHLSMQPGVTRASVADLYRNLQHGLVLLNDAGVSPDQELSSGSFSWAPMCFEVQRGKLVRRILGNVAQFNTRTFFKGLTAVGDVSTVCRKNATQSKGYPWQESLLSATAPAALFKEVNVMGMR